MAELSHWIEWKEKCALGLCSKEAQQDLQGFTWSRFDRYMDTYLHMTNLDANQPYGLTAPDVWHQFEAYLRIRNTRAGKAYKQWLFARSGRPDQILPAVEGGATLLMRDVVREFLRSEHSTHNTCSLNQSEEDGNEVCLIDLLPSLDDASLDHESHDIEDLAVQESKIFFGNLKRRERIILLVREMGWSLAHPKVERITGARKSALSNQYHRILEDLAKYVDGKYEREVRSVRCQLTCLVFELLKNLIISWGRVENDLADFFKVMDER